MFLLPGGAVTMTAAMSKSSLAQWLADGIHGFVLDMNWWQAILALMLGTHIIRIGIRSNVATIAMLVPVDLPVRDASVPWPCQPGRGT
jgi:di/tricarboxylate transporter